jgi:hypothetical protein
LISVPSRSSASCFGADLDHPVVADQVVGRRLPHRLAVELVDAAHRAPEPVGRHERRIEDLPDGLLDQPALCQCPKNPACSSTP